MKEIISAKEAYKISNEKAKLQLEILIDQAEKNIRSAAGKGKFSVDFRAAYNEAEVIRRACIFLRQNGYLAHMSSYKNMTIEWGTAK